MPYPKTKQIRTERRAVAEARQAAYTLVPLEEKLKNAGAKERAKLEAKQAAAEAKKAAESKPAKAKKAKS